MSVASFQTHKEAVDAYNALVELRHLREVGKAKEAQLLRKKNEEGNIWYRGQYRPTWTQESVADLSTVIDELNLPAKIYWEDLWRKGDDKYWNATLVQHEEIGKFSPREESLALKELAEKAKLDFANLRKQEQAAARAAAQEGGEPVQQNTTAV